MKQSTTSSTVRCSLLPPQLYFIRKATACLHSFIPICADSIAVGMVIVMSEPLDYGHFDIILAEYLLERHISKNSLAAKANLQRTQLNAYCKNDIKRPDLDVLARICYALDCDLADIIRYVRSSEKNEEVGNS